MNNQHTAIPYVIIPSWTKRYGIYNMVTNIIRSFPITAIFNTFKLILQFQSHVCDIIDF